MCVFFKLLVVKVNSLTIIPCANNMNLFPDEACAKVASSSFSKHSF